MSAKNTVLKTSIIALVAIFFYGCSAQQTSQVIETTKVESYQTAYSGKKASLAIGKFENRSNYLQGIFSDNIDRLGNQSKTILEAHLQQTNRFKVMNRENMDENRREAELSGIKQKIAGARYTVTGAVTEFGRKAIGDHQLFGILGSGKKQIAYSKVTLNIVDVATSEVVYSVQGAGEFALSNREIAGFGTTASYDATLNGKVLDLAIKEAVNNLVRGLEQNQWKIED